MNTSRWYISKNLRLATVMTESPLDTLIQLEQLLHKNMDWLIFLKIFYRSI